MIKASLITIFLIFFSSTSFALTDEEIRNEINEEFADRSDLPLRMDEDTLLIDGEIIAYRTFSFTYRIETNDKKLKNRIKNEIWTVRNNHEKVLQELYCEEDDWQYYRDNEVDMIHIFKDKYNKIMFMVSTSNSDCR